MEGGPTIFGAALVDGGQPDPPPRTTDAITHCISSNIASCVAAAAAASRRPPMGPKGRARERAGGRQSGQSSASLCRWARISPCQHDISLSGLIRRGLITAMGSRVVLFVSVSLGWDVISMFGGSQPPPTISMQPPAGPEPSHSPKTLPRILHPPSHLKGMICPNFVR